MKINRENYEPYFIDLLDGTLSDEMVDELLDFLRLNPDLAEELKGLEGIKLQPEEPVKFNHSNLLKTGFDQPEIFDETCIRSIEKDLSAKEEKEFQRYLKQDKKAETEYKLFKATISEPDLLIEYPKKSSLKHTIKFRSYWIAAAAVFVLGFVFWFNAPQHPEVEKIAQSVPVVHEQPEVEVELEPLKDHFAKVENIATRHEIKKPEPVQIALNRNDKLIKPLPANLSIAKFKSSANSSFALAPVPANIETNHTDYYPAVPELIAEKVNKIDWKKGMQMVSHFTLNKLRKITDDKLDYISKPDGEVTKIEFNSKLLAFSVPVNSKEN